MKHIVFVIGNYTNGGVAMRATNLANQFGANGYRVTVESFFGIACKGFINFCPGDWENFVRKKMELGVPVDF